MLISIYVLAEIYYFKPQTVLVSTMFLAIISYVLGLMMEVFIPTRGWFRYLNPVRSSYRPYKILFLSCHDHRDHSTERKMP